jgi:hypothetical protein
MIPKDRRGRGGVYRERDCDVESFNPPTSDLPVK